MKWTKADQNKSLIIRQIISRNEKDSDNFHAKQCTFFKYLIIGKTYFFESRRSKACIPLQCKNPRIGVCVGVKPNTSILRLGYQHVGILKALRSQRES